MRSPRSRPTLRVIVRTTAPRMAVRTHGPRHDRACCPAKPTPASSRSTAFIPTRARPSSGRAHFNERFAELVAREAALLRAKDAALVVADAPPLACAAADDAGIPAVVCANFTWDWIYREYREQPGVAELVAAIGDNYARASACVAAADPRRLRDDPEHRRHPFVARRGRAQGDRRSVETRLGLPPERPLALVSFGGYGLRQLPLDRLDCLRDWGIVVSSPGEEPQTAAGRRSQRSRGRDVRRRPPLRGPRRSRGCRHHQAGLRHHLGLRGQRRGDALHVARTVSRNTRSWSARCRGSCAAGASNPRRSQTARWNEGLRELSALPPPPEQPRVDGAEVVAAMIAGRVSAL